MATQDSFTNRLSDYLDDEELTPAERTAIEAHLTECVACRTTLGELRAVKARAASLIDTGPATDLWAGVAARVNPLPRVRPFAARLQRRFSFTLPQLVAAGLALMVLSGALVTLARRNDPRTNLPPIEATNDPRPVVAPASFADSQYEQAIGDLERTLEAGRNRLDAETIRVIEENLRAIDLAIDQARKALRADPESVYLNNHFAESRYRKLALLRRANALMMAGDTGS